MNDVNPTLIVSAFIRQDDKYLMISESKFTFWRVPGGRVEENETDKQTLKREMMEELGIEINIGRFLGEGRDYVELNGEKMVSRLIHYYECTIKSGKPVKKEATIKKMQWKTLEEIKEIENLEPAMIAVLGKIK